VLTKPDDTVNLRFVGDLIETGNMGKLL